MLSIALLALAAQNVGTLRTIGAGGFETKAALAEALGRDASNLSKSLEALRDGGLLSAPGGGAPAGILTPDARSALVLIEKAERGTVDEDETGLLALRHEHILPDPDNARRDWDSEDARADLEALAADLLEQGLLQNLVVRLNDTETGPNSFGAYPAPGDFILVGGERRWRAIGLLIERGDWPADRTIACRLLDADEAGVRIAALAENLQRRNLNPIEEAKAFRGLKDVGLTTEEIAARVSMTQRHIQMRLQLIEDLSEEDQQRMTLSPADPQFLSPTEARRLVQAVGAQRKARDKAEADLTPRQRLILAEIRAAAKDGYIYERIQVDAEALDADEDATALHKAGLLRVPTTLDSEGKAFAYCEGQAWETTRLLFTEGSAAYAARMRSELGLPEPAEGQWSTPWLNGPFTLSPETQARVDAARTERERKEAEWTAQREADQAESKAREAEMERVRDSARAVRFTLAGDPGSRPPADAFTSVAEAAGHRLPWTPAEDGRLIDADGEEIFATAPYYGRAKPPGLAALELLAAAVNAAAGLPTPEEPPLPLDQRPLSEEAFVEAMQAAIDAYDDEDLAAIGDATARQILDAMLEHIGEAFGHPDYEWTAAGAAVAVHGYPYDSDDDAEADANAAGDDAGEGGDQ